MRVYIASRDRWSGLYLAQLLVAGGHEITSSWLTEPFLPTEQYTPEIRRAIADKDAREVSSSDALVVIACRERVPGGKFVEAGIAIGKGLRVLILGHRENMLMWHSGVQAFDEASEIVAALGRDD
jgi:nucleoside 2-deoxyribosyltransferase